MTTSSPLCNNFSDFVNSELDGKLDFESEDSEADNNNDPNFG